MDKVNKLLKNMQLFLEGKIETHLFEDVLIDFKFTNSSQARGLYFEALADAKPQGSDTEKNIFNILTILMRSDDEIKKQIDKTRSVGNYIVADCYESLFKYLRTIDYR